MESEEPSTSLVYALGNKIGGIEFTAVEALFILKRIMDLGIWHCTGIEPYVDKVCFAVHFTTGFGYENDVVDIRTVEVNLFIIGLVVVPRFEPFCLQRVGLHDSGGYRFLDFVVELLNRAYADFLATVVGTPDGERRTPVAAAREIPVLKVLQPFAESAGTGSGRFPLDALVELHEPFACCRCANKPAVEGIVEHRFVRTPAVGIAVHVFLDFEHFPLLFQP